MPACPDDGKHYNACCATCGRYMVLLRKLGRWWWCEKCKKNAVKWVESNFKERP